MAWVRLAATAMVVVQLVLLDASSVSAEPARGTIGQGGAFLQSSDAPTDSQGCAVDGVASEFAPRINDFGRFAYTSDDDDGYWDGRGYLFGFRRDDREAMMSNPWGAYLVGGIVLAENEGLAAQEFKQAVEDWPREWYQNGPVETVEGVPTFGAETVVLRHLSTWEIDKQQPMTEVFLAFRYCNLNAHLMVATMPDQDAVAQAVRYASIIQAHIRH
jgi:hypothetical protein